LIADVEVHIDDRVHLIVFLVQATHRDASHGRLSLH
jgi:hypothetical protein